MIASHHANVMNIVKKENVNRMTGNVDHHVDGMNIVLQAYVSRPWK